MSVGGIGARVRVSAIFLCLLAGSAPAADTPPGAAIASANRQATAAGFAVLDRGGNAFDAAVAVSAALSVVEPESSGLGGGGFFLLYRASDGMSVFVDARERAPLAASRDMYLDANGVAVRARSVNGALAAAIPGLPAGLVHVSKTYGKLKLAETLAPAIKLAEKGYLWSRKNETMLDARREQLAQSKVASALFMPENKPPAVGTRMRNPAIAGVLKTLAREGHDGFYRGQVATRLVAGVRAAGGIWTAEDLAAYRAVEREPLRFRYRGQQILTAPPSSSGGVALVALLNILEAFPLTTFDRVQRRHVEVEAMRRVYRDRAIYLGDPDFVVMPLEMLTHPFYAAGLRASIRLDRATPSAALPGIDAKPGGTDTSHFSIIDAEGNVVAVTQSVNLPFGSAFAVADTGFMLNNEMDDFSTKPGVPNAYGLIGEDANAIEPGKRPLSSMTPTILLGEKRVAALGSPGGSRIITMVFQGLSSLLEGASAAQAVAAPRMHHQYLPDIVQIEPGALDAAELDAMKARGFTVVPTTEPWGNMQIVLWDKVANTVEAASDPRWKDVGGGTSRKTQAIYQ